MIIIPAVDIKDGKCVRLFQGDLNQATVYGDDPASMAERWDEEGAEWLHVVDLDGAVAGEPKHIPILQAICDRVDVNVQFGGGVRKIEHVRSVFEAGADRLILGTVVLEAPELLKVACDEFPGLIYVALDAREGKVAVRGWTETTDVDAIDAARRCTEAGASGILFTDISRDGTGRGVNIGATQSMAEAVNVPVVASGGASTLDDIRAVRSIEPSGVEALIIGRALYSGSLTLAAAMAAACGVKSEEL